ncbi:polysaccharide deacetylase family protein [Rhodocyclus tenuis]|uniref:Polysaccharide deacetylase family protein n=2 Tax=Rhodocyclus TaxID=1064 RepID=A0A6L5JZP6_RHOTE|nr:polysaccharide deacetylase family protein [Rhodocyclus gracilis]
MYHHVSPSPGLVTVSPQRFREQMAWLARRGWTALGADDIARFYAGEAVPKRSLVITFDDGYLDNFIHAHPVLTEFGLKAMLFVVTGWLGEGPVRRGAIELPNHRECKRRLAEGTGDSVVLRWSEVELMHSTGSFEFHSHTHTHTRWDLQLPTGPDRIAAISQELALSRAALERRLGYSSDHLCWPQGYYEADYVDAAVKQGFNYLYTTENKPNLRTGDPLHIGRVVTKERSAAWLGQRLAIYGSPLLSHLYTKLRKS